MGKRKGGGYHDIGEYYEHLIRTGGLAPGLILPTEVELAKQHSVTRTTVRRAFASLVNKGLVTKKQGLGTRVAMAAEVEGRARSHVIIAAPMTQTMQPMPGVYHRDDHYHDGLYQYIESLALGLADYSRRFRIAYYREDSAGMEAVVASAREDGAMGIVAVDIGKAECVDRLAACGMPVVFLDCHTHARAVDAVKADNFAGAREATEFMLRTAGGPVAFVGASSSREEGSPHQERLAGFLEANREAGREVPDDLIHLGQVGSITGATAVDRTLARTEPPTGYVCSDDELAIGVLERLQVLGVPVPARAGVFGFGASITARATTPLLSTVMIDRRSMGQRAVELLHARLDDPSRPPEVVSVPVVVYPRQSTIVSLPDARPPR